MNVPRVIMKNLLTISLAALGLLAGLLSPVQAQDADAGEKKAAMCIGCHGIPGYQASFPEVHKVPMISGQSAKYIANSLAAYKKGDRKHPTMRGIATSLTDQDMADLAAFYASHGEGVPVPEALVKQPSAEVAALLQRGNCASCHGANYAKPIDPSYPKIAGQYADYLFVALKSYQDASHALYGRNNAIMGGMVKSYTKAELKLIANYLGSLEGGLLVVPQSRFR